ncbi:MAG: putative nucleotidyltransferase substrate binding domain-containing protein, partial [Actinomycetota bacterium]
GFLRRFPPFDALAEADLDRIASSVEIEYFLAGSVILLHGEVPSAHLYVVRKGAVELVDRGRSFDVLTAGEVFGHPSLLSGLPITSDVRALEDTICYLIDADSAEEVFSSAGGLRFLSLSLLRRRERVVEAVQLSGALPQLVAALMHRPPIVCSPDLPIRGAVERMATARISALLVVEGPETLGIVTDRDIRSRVVAVGTPTDAPIRTVMSSPVITVASTMPVDEVLLVMIEHGIHHLAVVDADRGVIGVVTDTDVLGLERMRTFQLRSAIEKVDTRDGAVAEARRLPELLVALELGDMDPVHIGRVVSITLDSLTRRLLQFAIDDLGDPPAAWAWLALGSQARREQALVTDQDHALAFDAGDGSDPLGDDDVSRMDAYFRELAVSVTDGLEAAGIPRCPGGVMAENDLWRLPSRKWAMQFPAAIRDPGPGGRVFTNIALDYRRIAGSLDIEPTLDAAIQGVPADHTIARRIVSSAVSLRPPTGFFGNLVLDGNGSDADTFDVKHGGIVPVTNLARAYAVCSGLVLDGTIERLRGVPSSGFLEPGQADVLEDAFRLLWRIRLRHQAEAVDRGTTANDHVDPRSLTPVTRSALKQAFREIAHAQRRLMNEVGIRT